MQTHQHKKIDLSSDYPCPACRRGRLMPITLTEAFGCERCQQIFVLNENGYILEGLSTTYPYPKKWCWTGRQWSVEHSTGRWSYLLPPLITVFLFALGAGLFAILAIFSNGIPPSFFKWGMVLGIMAVVAAAFWIVFRR